MKGGQVFRRTRAGTIGACVVVVVLLLACCLIPIFRIANAFGSTRLSKAATACNDALHARLPGSISAVPSHILRTAGAFLNKIHSVPVANSHFLLSRPSTARLSASIRTRSLTPMFVCPALKVRAPPQPFPAKSFV